jgi:hypothetical protein
MIRKKFTILVALMATFFSTTVTAQEINLSLEALLCTADTSNAFSPLK